MSIYLDHNATSPLHPEVLEAMMPYLREPVANASSLHSAGRMARSAIEELAALEIEHKHHHLEPLRVVFEARLKAIASLALNAVRVSMAMSNSLQDINALANKLEDLVNKLPAIIRPAAAV